MNFEALFNPSTTLGAFLISILSGVLVSFIIGIFTGKKIEKKNILRVKNNHGEINQDVRNNYGTKKR